MEKMKTITQKSGRDDQHELLEELNKLVDKGFVNTKKLDVPQYLICPITDDLMEEPVVLQSGFTYEKSAVKKHFETNGDHCPMTRDWVDVDKLVPNNSIKQATEDFLRENPWGFEFCPGDDINSVTM